MALAEHGGSVRVGVRVSQGGRRHTPRPNLADVDYHVRSDPKSSAPATASGYKTCLRADLKPITDNRKRLHLLVRSTCTTQCKSRSPASRASCTFTHMLARTRHAIKRLMLAQHTQHEQVRLLAPHAVPCCKMTAAPQWLQHCLCCSFVLVCWLLRRPALGWHPLASFLELRPAVLLHSCHHKCCWLLLLALLVSLHTITCCFTMRSFTRTMRQCTCSARESIGRAFCDAVSPGTAHASLAARLAPQFG